MVLYYWISFAVTLACALYVPGKRVTGADNLVGSLICAMFGFILWPLFVWAARKVYKYRQYGAEL